MSLSTAGLSLSPLRVTTTVGQRVFFNRSFVLVERTCFSRRPVRGSSGVITVCVDVKNDDLLGRRECAVLGSHFRRSSVLTKLSFFPGCNTGSRRAVMG